MTQPTLQAALSALGDRLSELRQQAGRSIEQMAAEFDPPWPDRVMHWEAGTHTPTLRVLARYAQVFDTTVSQMLEGIL